jgi:hypothetical protein
MMEGSHLFQNRRYLVAIWRVGPTIDVRYWAHIFNIFPYWGACDVFGVLLKTEPKWPVLFQERPPKTKNTAKS